MMGPFRDHGLCFIWLLGPNTQGENNLEGLFWLWILNYNRKRIPEHLEASSCTGLNNFWAGVLGSWWRQGHFFLLSGVLITIHLLLWGMITCQGSFELLASWRLSPPPPDYLNGCWGAAPQQVRGRKITFYCTSLPFWTGSHSNSLCPAKPDNRTVMVRE